MVLGIVGNNTTNDGSQVPFSDNALYGVTVPVDTWLTHVEMLFGPGGGSGIWRCGIFSAIPVPASNYNALWQAYVDINGTPNASRNRQPLSTKVKVLAGNTFYVASIKQSGNAVVAAEQVGAAPVNASGITTGYYTNNPNTTDFANLAGYWLCLAAYADGTSGGGAIAGSADDNMVRVMVAWLNTNDPGKNYERTSITDLERAYYWKRINGAGSPVPANSSTNDLARAFYSQGLSNTYTKTLNDLMIEYMRANAAGVPAAASLGDLALLYWGGL